MWNAWSRCELRSHFFAPRPSSGHLSPTRPLNGGNSARRPLKRAGPCACRNDRRRALLPNDWLIERTSTDSKKQNSGAIALERGRAGCDRFAPSSRGAKRRGDPEVTERPCSPRLLRSARNDSRFRPNRIQALAIGGRGLKGFDLVESTPVLSGEAGDAFASVWLDATVLHALAHVLQLVLKEG